MASGGFTIPVGLDFSGGFKSLDQFGDKVAGTAAAVSKDLGGSFSDAEKKLRATADAARDTATALALTGKQGTAEYRELVEQAKLAEAELTKLADVSRDVQAEIGGIGSAGGDDPLGGLGKKLSASLNFEALGGIGDALDSFEEHGAGARDAMKSLRAQTGLVGEDLEEVRGQAEAAFKNGVGENLSDSIKVMGTAKQQLGGFLKGDDLLVFTQRAAGIGKAFDKEASEVISKSRTFAQNFGLGGQQAGDLVALAMQKAGTGMDDVLDSLDEYSQLVKGAGFSAEQWIGTLTTGVQAGVRDTDKLADAIKETQIRINAGDASSALKDLATPITGAITEIVKAGESGKLSVQQVLQQSASAISDAFDSGKISAAMRDKLMVAVSGTPAEDIGGDLYTRIFSAPIDTNAVQEAAKKAGADIQNALGPTTIFEKLNRGFDLVKTKVSEFAGPVVGGLGKVMSTVSQVGPGINLISEKLGDGGLMGMMTKLGGSVGGLGSSLATFATGPIGLTIAAVAAVAAGIYLLYQNSQDVRDVVDEVGNVLAELWEILKTVGSIIFDVIVAGGKIWWETFKAVYGTIANVVSKLLGFKDAGTAVSSAFRFVKDAVASVGAKLKDFQVMLSGVQAGIGAFASAAGGALESLFSFDFAGAVSKISNAFDQAGAAARKATQATRIDQSNDKIRSEDLKKWEAYWGSRKGIFESGNRKQVEDTADAAAAMVQRAIAASTDPKQKEQLQGFITEINEAYQSALTRLKGSGGPVVPPPNTKKVETSFRDLTSSIESISKDTQSRMADAAKILAGVAANGFEDTFSNRRREIEQAAEAVVGPGGSLSKMVNGIEGQIKSLKENEKLTIDLTFSGDPTKAVPVSAAQIREALAKFKDANVSAVRAQMEAQLAALDKEFASQRAAATLKLATDETNQELTLLKAREILYTGEDLRGIEARGRLRMDALRLQQRNEMLVALQAIPEFQAALNAELGKAGPQTPESIQQTIDQISERFITSNESLRLLHLSHRQALVTGEKELYDQLDGIRKGTEDKELERLRQENFGVQIALNLRESFYKGFYKSIDEERQQALQTEIDALSGNANQVYKDYLDGRIQSYEDYASKIAEIQQERIAKELELERQKFEWMQSINSGLAQSFRGVAEESSKSLDKSLRDFAEGSITYEDVALDLATTLSAVGLQAVGEQKNVARAMLSTAFDTLQKFAAMWSAEILGKKLAAYAAIPVPGVGEALALAGWAGLMTIIQAAIAGTRAALGFEKGGLVPGGEQMIRINEKGREFVTNHRSTAANIDALTWLNANPGRRVEEWVLRNHGALAGSPVATHADMTKAIDRQTETFQAEISALRDEVATGMQRNIAVEIQPGPMRIDGDDFVTHQWNVQRTALMKG